MNRSNEADRWEKELREAYFPVALADVRVGKGPEPSKKFRAVIRTNESEETEPFAIVTDRYRLIRHEDAMDLGFEAFAQIFGPEAMNQLEVYNVISSKSGGGFLADLTAPNLRFDVRAPLPGDGSTNGQGSNDAHLVFLRVTNSYNKTQAVRVETGICRWICRNGIIFGEQAIRFKDPHHKRKESLMDDIAESARPLAIEHLPSELASAYGCQLPDDMGVLEGIWQTLRLAIPRPNRRAPNATQWVERCRLLSQVASRYESGHGRTAFGALQGASEWARESANKLPMQRHSYERRCGEMLENITRQKAWPPRKSEWRDQSGRMSAWTHLNEGSVLGLA